MKLRMILVLLPLFIVLMSGVITSCTDDEGGAPVIHFVRVTDPLKSDSLIAEALLGDLIAIVGENLEDTREVWFNDQQAYLRSTLVTSSSIIVNLPTQAPVEVSNKLKLVFGNGSTLLYDFIVSIPPPIVASMNCEYVADGGIAAINGDYFFEPIVVTFADGTQAEVTSVETKTIKFKVPGGIDPGPITVSTNFGETESSFWFRDNRNIILNYDDKTASGSWRPGLVGSEGGIEGNYLILRGELDKNQRTEDFPNGGFVSQFWGQANGRPEGPLFNGALGDMVLKFEAKIPEWYGSYLNICFAPWNNNGNQEYWSNSFNPRAYWGPWDVKNETYKTNGWITVTIPMTEMQYFQDAGGDVTYVSGNAFNMANAGSLSFWVVGSPKADKSPVEIHIDNVRIVSK